MIRLDMPEAEYHSHPALSSTGARQLLESPATFQYQQTHPQPSKPAFDLGTAVHSKVLGFGAPTVAIPTKLLASNGAVSTKAAKDWVAEARGQGKTPVKGDVFEQVNGMAESILAHPVAHRLFEQEGNPEASIFGTDPDTGVELRARFDFLPNFMQDNPWAVDLKTTAKKADAESFAKVVAEHGYDVQQEHYLHTHALATGDPSMRMKFVVVETNAPYLVAVHELSLEFVEIGAARAKRARELFAECTTTGVWPGYEVDPLPLQPPLWHIYMNQELVR